MGSFHPHPEEKKFSFTNKVKPFEYNIQELANELVYNHLANSFGDDTGQEVYTEYIFDTSLEPDQSIRDNNDAYGWRADSYAAAFAYRREQNKSCRNILVIGAGASYDSYAYIPLGGTLRNALEEKFKEDIKNSPLVKQKYEEDERDIKRLSKEGYDFENCLSLLANFFPADKLREEIQRLTQFRYEPSLFYEIVAHLFKHNFFDVIINFNFDELLDNALEEEVGTQNYYHIVHDGDCPTMSDLVEEGRLKVPIYLKPHGTTRHATTLRFTKRHYLDIPPKIKQLMEALIGGQRKDEEADCIKRVNLVCVGFDLTSLEFNEILDSKLPSESRIYHIAYGNTSDEKRDTIRLHHLPKFLKSNQERKLISIDIANFDAINSDSLISPYAEIMSNLWRAVYNRFQTMYRPRSIGRHEIL